MTERSRVLCPEGDFAIESDDETELIQLVQDHVETKHDRELSHAEIREMIEDEDMVAGIE